MEVTLQQAAAAPAIVSFMANAAADGLVGSSKCLVAHKPIT
jgi:hypothetical protein